MMGCALSLVASRAERPSSPKETAVSDGCTHRQRAGMSILSAVFRAHRLRAAKLQSLPEDVSAPCDSDG